MSSLRSSGDLIADRRYRYAEAAFAEDDFAAAADLARQTLELAPDFAAAWFMLGQSLAAAGDDAGRGEAIAAFQRALALDPEDGLGARLRLAALGIGPPEEAMQQGYVRALFDDYAPRFERQLVRSLAYRGPGLLHDAVRRACSLRLRAFRFGRALDLGCGTGLAARAFAAECQAILGVDLSPAMLARAGETRLYADLATGDLTAWLRGQPDGSADLILAADVFVYVADLAPILVETRRVLARDGLLAFTVQAHEGAGIVLGEDLRYAHAEPLLREACTAATLDIVLFEPVSTRQDRGRDVPGFLAVCAGPAQRSLPSGANR